MLASDERCPQDLAVERTNFCSTLRIVAMIVTCVYGCRDFRNH
jgi:hypothetical protein